MSEDARTLLVGGMIGVEGVVAMVGNDLPYPEADIKQQLDSVMFMEAVGCLNCIVMSELGERPRLDIQAVLKREDRTLITAVCPGAVQMIKEGKQEKLQCHDPKRIELVFEQK